jgi:hypothetical protein
MCGRGSLSGYACVRGSQRVEFYSTPFVFLTDTFTGKFLGVFYSGRGHPFLNDVSVCDCVLVFI